MQVFASIFPIVAVAAFGWFLRRRALISPEENQALERLTFLFLIPFLLFTGTATAELPERMDWGFLGGFYLAVVLVYALTAVIGVLFYRHSPLEQSVFGMGGAYSNVTVVGIPVCLQLLGEAAFLPMFILIAFHNLFLFAVGTLVAERRREQGGRLLAHLGQVTKNLLLNPITGSLFAGAVVNLLGIPLWGPLVDAFRLLGQAAVPMALFVLGASLTRYRVSGELGAALWLVGIKLLVLPALVWTLMFGVFEVRPLWGATAVLLSAMPVGISVYVFSRRYQCCETQAAAAIVLSSLLAVGSISFWSWLLATRVL